MLVFSPVRTMLIDPSTLIEADDSVLAKAGSASPKLIRTVTVNKVPSLFKIDAVPTEIATQAESLSKLSDLHERVGQALAGRYADREEPEHVELQIYSGFYSYDDKHRLEQFQKIDWSERYLLINQFDDRRLRQLGQRLIYLYAPELIDPDRRGTLDRAINDRWHANDPHVPWMTIEKVTIQLDEIAKSGKFESSFLNNLRSYYRSLKLT
jgi:exodeoxyribonuclease-1